ncbi:28101_t:CDS:2, partial [Racocetra persica]
SDSSHVIASVNSDSFFFSSLSFLIETRYMSFLDEQQKSTLLYKLDDILSIPVDKLSDIKIYNSLNDGNCGFHVLAIAIRGNEENWNLIKLAMSNQLNKRIEIYKDWLGYNINLLKQILEFQALSCYRLFWFLSPDCTQLAATLSLFLLLFLMKEMNR